MIWRAFARAGILCAFTAFGLTRPGVAQEIAQPAQTSARHPWIEPDLLARARKEGALVVYSSMNEGEALPLWKIFENDTGIKVNLVRGSDTELLARILLEARARQLSWDVIGTTAVSKLPPGFLAQIDPPEAKNIIAEARDPNKRWYGMYANYNAPAYNTQHVKASDLPATYEDFLKHKEWAGHVAINQTDDEWLDGIYTYYGADRGHKLVQDLVSTLKPALVSGHLALARALGSGDYWIALSNFINLTINVRMSGAPVDYWGVDPISLVFGELGVSAHAPHPNAARLAANFLLSKEGQTQLTHAGRIPVRKDVTPNPPDAVSKLGNKKLIVVNLSTDEDKQWARRYRDLFRTR